MARYVDINDVEKELKNFTSLFFDEIKEHLKKIPTANVRPILRGKWTSGCFASAYFPKSKNESGLHTAYCTNCHITQTVNTYKGTVQFNFCPYCGADMRERDKNDL